MSKASRTHRQTPNKEIRITLTLREFNDFQGVVAVAAIKIQSIQQRAAQEIAAAQGSQQKELLRLANKYRHLGMRPDKNYRFDEATHSLILLAG